MQPLFLPYRSEQDASDWRMVMLVTSVMSIRNADVFVLLVIVAILFFIIWLHYKTGGYVLEVLREHLPAKTVKGRRLLIVVLATVVVWVLSLAGLFATLLHWTITANLMGWMFVLCGLCVLWADHKEQPDTRHLTTPVDVADVRQFLNSYPGGER